MLTHRELTRISRRARGQGDVAQLLKAVEACLQRLRQIAARPCYDSYVDQARAEGKSPVTKPSGHAYACGACDARAFLKDVDEGKGS